MDMIYLIIKVGAYRHDIFGACTDAKEASTKAKALADTDKDDYHEYVVQPVAVNEPCAMSKESSWAGHTADEPVPGVSFRKAT